MANNYSSDQNNALPVNSAEVPRAPSTNGEQPALSAASASSSAGPGDARRLAAGTLLSGGRYRIERLQAYGGMGAVYRATDTRFNRPCAVKEMLDEFRNEAERLQAVEWFSREATLLLDLNHPCIPRVRDFFAETGKHYLVMDFIDGRTLSDVMEKEGTVLGVNGARGITEERARNWTRQVCGVLSYLHRQVPPIIFRDLKPSNIMVTSRDEIKLIDFGIARTFQRQQQSTVIMTLGYAPPEQMHGMPEPRSDLFALGATLHRLVTHHDANNNKPNIFVFPTLRSLRPDISIAFDQVIMKALVLQVEQRWPNAEEMDRVLSNLPPITAVPSLVGPAQPGMQVVTPTPNLPVASGLPPVASGPGIAPVLPPVASGPGVAGGTTGPAASHIQAAIGHLTNGRIDAAHEAVMMAHGLEANNSLVHKLFGQIYARRRPPQITTAVAAYNRSLQLYADDAETHKLIGDVWLYLQPNFNLAIQAYIQSLRLNPNDFETHERLGECYDKTNRPDGAVHEHQEAVRLASAQPELVRCRLYFALGQVAMRARQWQIAEHAFVQVLIYNPSDHQARSWLSQVYEQQGKLDEAFRECGYVMNGPLAATNPAVAQMYYRLKNRLGR